MAAYFYINQDGVRYEKRWHIGTKPNLKKEEIIGLEKVQIDGDEAYLLYGYGLDLSGDKVHMLSGNQAKLYALLVICLYNETTSYRDMETNFNTYLKGINHPNTN
ncbi:MAG: hypothetical protein AAGJ18_26860 [Bacteroidota bacterium]